MKYELTKPCNNCPFRSDKLFPLKPGRVKEILDSLMRRGEFPCHKTTQHDDDGNYVKTETEQHCVGVLILLEKNGAT